MPRQLGCRIRRDGSVHCSGYEATDVPGVFIAGNIAGDVQLVMFAAAEGAKAAFGINRSLTREDFELSATGRRIVEHPDRGRLEPVTDLDTAVRAVGVILESIASLEPDRPLEPAVGWKVVTRPSGRRIGFVVPGRDRFETERTRGSRSVHEACAPQ